VLPAKSYGDAAPVLSRESAMSVPLHAETLCSLSEAEFEELWKRLLLYAQRNYGWLEGRVRGGFDTKELVTNAVEDFLFGVRRNQLNLPLYVFLCGVIRSQAYHIGQAEIKRLSLDHSEGSILSESARPEINRLVRPQENCSDRAQYNELSEKVLKLVQGDEILTMIIKLLIKDPELRPREIAEMLSLDIKVVRSAKKRLDRRIQCLKEWIND
jgi:hypothetical protein